MIFLVFGESMTFLVSLVLLNGELSLEKNVI